MFAELMNENVRIRAENVKLREVVFALIAQADKDPFMSIGHFVEHNHASATLAEIRALKDEQARHMVQLIKEQHDAAQPKRRPYNASASLSEYGIFPECDAAQAPHPDDVAVDCFAAAMKAKLNKKRQEGRGGWQSMTAEQLSALLHEHVRKGDPVDVANLAMMLHQNGQRIEQQPAPDVDGLAARLVDELDDLVSESGGVSGLHLNGDVATWEELLPGGRFERLSSLDELREALAIQQRTSDGGAA